MAITITPATQKVISSENVLVEDLDEESVLLNLDTLTYSSQDDVGTRMFNVLIESNSIEQAYQTLLSEYQVEPELLKKDLFNYIEQLVEQGLIEIKDN